MHVMRETWTDARLDDLNHRVDQGFNRVDADIRTLRSEVGDLRSETKAGFERVDERFEAMHRLLLRFCWLALVTLVGLAAPVIGLVATKL